MRKTTRANSRRHSRSPFPPSRTLPFFDLGKTTINSSRNHAATVRPTYSVVGPPLVFKAALLVDESIVSKYQCVLSFVSVRLRSLSPCRSMPRDRIVLAAAATFLCIHSQNPLLL
jgi:hypothetical protein